MYYEIEAYEYEAEIRITRLRPMSMRLRFVLPD